MQLQRQTAALEQLKMETSDCLQAARTFRSVEKHWRSRGHDKRAAYAATLAVSWEIAARQRRLVP
jgi:hypothetical protein